MVEACSGGRWVLMENGNGEQQEGWSLKDIELWKVQRRFIEEGGHVENGKVEWLELIRIEMSLHVLH